MDIKEFAKKVEAMRSLQKAFFKAASQGHGARQQVLQKAKEAEREIDNYTSEILYLPSNQTQLFS